MKNVVGSQRLFWLVTLLIAAIAVTGWSVGESRRADLIDRQTEVTRRISDWERQSNRMMRLQRERLRNAEQWERVRHHHLKGDFWRREELERWDHYRELLLNAV